MSNFTFEDLYGDDKARAFSIFFSFANDFLDGYAIPVEASVDFDAAYVFVNSGLRRDVFPASGGYDGASPFKKAAYLYVWLHALDPFKPSAPRELFGDEVAKFGGKATATIIGFALVKSCLLGVNIKRKDASTVTLSNPLQISKHFMVDLIEASAHLDPDKHFKTISLLFEALAYEANPRASYPKVF